MSKLSHSLGLLFNRVFPSFKNTIQKKTIIIGILCLAGGGTIFGMKMIESNMPLLADHSAGGDSSGSGTMDEWCAAWRSGGSACENLCNQYGMSGDSSCVSGCQNMTESQCDGSYSGTSTSESGDGSTGGTSGGVERCFYPAEWYSESQGKQWGGTLNCKSDMTDCREGSETDALVSGEIAFTGGATSCYSSGGTSGGGSTTGGSTGGSTTGGSTTGGGTTGTTGSTTGPSAFDMCMDGCGLPRQATSEQKQANTCYASYCKSMDPSPPADATQTGGSSGSSDCALQCERDIGTADSGKLGNCKNACAQGYLGGYMRNCFYPGATRNGSPLGFTPKCEEHSYTCKDHQGNSISLSGIRLGAADESTCSDTGNTGGEYNGEPYNGGSYNGSYDNGSYNNGMNSGYHGSYESTNTESRRQQLQWEVQDHERQANEMKASAREAGAQIDDRIKEYQQTLSKAKSCINAATSGQVLVECDQMLMKAREHSGTIWNTIQRGHEDKNRKMWDRQIGEMENVIGQMAGADVSNLQQILSELKAAIANANSVSGNTNTTEELSRKAWQRVDDLQSQFWKETNAFRPGGNEGNEGYGRSPTEACERMKVEAQHADPSVQVKIKALVQECFGIMEKSTVGSAVGEGEMHQAMEGLMRKFGEIMNSSWQRGACDDARRGVDDARNAITTFAPMMVRKVQTQNPGTAAMLESLLTTARSILTRAEQALQRNDCDAAMKEMSGMDTKVRMPFEAAMAKAGFDSMDEDEEFTLVNYDQQYGEIYQRAGEHGAQYEDFARSMKEKGYGLGELNVLKTIDPQLMGIAQKSEGAEVVKAATSANVDRVKLEELLAAKDAIIVQLEKQVQNLQAGMAAIVTRIAKYTPHPSVANNLSDLVQRASSLTAEQFEQEFALIDSQTRDAAVKDGWTQYTDAYHFDPQQQWYAGAVNEMSDRGVFTGTDPQNHIFGAGQTANGAELVTVLARIVGIEDGAQPTSEYADNLPDWAASAGGTLDTLLPGSLDTYLSGEAGRGVTRMEIALLIADLFGDDLPETDSENFENFQDAQQIPVYARKAIASVVAAGIITGQEREGGKFFDPDGTVTREQLATILSRLLLLLEDEGESDTPAGSTAATAPSSKTDAEPAIKAEKKPAAPPAPAFDLTSITKGEAKLVYSLLLKEYDDIVAAMQSASAAEKLETWVPKKNAAKDAIKTWEKINIEKTYAPYSTVPDYKMNIANKLMLDQVNVINDILRNPTARAQ